MAIQSSTSAQPTKIFFVLQDVASFRIDWRSLYDPERHRLVLVASTPRFAAADASGQARYFERVVRTDDFTVDGLSALVGGLLIELGVTDLDAVGIVTHDEYSLAVAAQLRERLGIAGATYDDVRSFVDKIEMKRGLAGKGIRLPRHLAFAPDAYAADPDAYVARVVAQLALPIFAKPTNESGTVGGTRLDNWCDLDAWCRARLADPDDPHAYELDEFVSGTLYHCDSFIRSGRILHTEVSRYAHPCYDYLEGKICSSTTLPCEGTEFRRLAAFAREVLEALPAVPADTVTHLEVFEKGDGELVFLEIAARAPAAMVPYTYAKRLGVNIEEAHFRLQMGLLDELELNRGPHAAWAYFPHRAGVVADLHEPRLRSEFEFTAKVGVGDLLADPDDIRDFACSVMLWNDDYDVLCEDLAYLDRFEPYSLADAELHLRERPAA
jgi:hypothetical protein